MRTPLPAGLLVVTLLLGACARAGAGEPPPKPVNLPDGYRIEMYAQVPEARSLAVVPELGVVFVGQRGGTRVHAIIDDDMDGTAEDVQVALRDLKSPNGIAWRDGWFYVAEQHRVSRWRADSLKALRNAEPQVLYDDLPDDSWHGWRYAGFGPDGMLYIAVGSPCNICETDGLEGTIVRLDPAGGDPEVYASGIRNSVGLDFQPGTGILYFTDNGADGMGDNSPPDELNRAPSPGLWFGFPWYGGGDHRTPDFAGEPVPREATFPVVDFGAHVAALGIHFYEGAMFPADVRGDAFVAQHGSWNRTVPDGYRVVHVRFDDDGRTTGYETFADGWLNPDGSKWGRPVDVKALPDGSLLVSDDRLGAVYRITYGN